MKLFFIKSSIYYATFGTLAVQIGLVGEKIQFFFKSEGFVKIVKKTIFGATLTRQGPP